MTHEEKVAVARIMSDIVKADGHLSVEQFRLATELEEQYHFTPEEMAQSRHITFGNAVLALKELTRHEKKEFIEKMKDLAFSDRIITADESRLLTALHLVLEKGINILSIPTAETRMHEMRMVYMESEYNETANQELSDPNTYRLIDGLCRLSGISFAYIPNMMADFAKLDKESVCNFLRYMSPTLSDEEAANIGRRMAEISSSEFYLKVMHPLMSKLQTPLTSFIAVNVGLSMTPYCSADGQITYFKEYLYLPIEGSVLKTVDDFLQTFKSFITVAYKPLESSDSYNFQFYKLFFDFLLTPPPVEPDFIFGGQEPKSGKYQIIFRFGDNEKRVFLAPKEYEALHEIFVKTFQSRTKGMAIGMDRTTLAPIISHIRQKITAELPEIALAERYKPERSGNKYTVNLDRKKVFVRKYKSLVEWEDVPF